jgi:hypothetical protein
MIFGCDFISIFKFISQARATGGFYPQSNAYTFAAACDIATDVFSGGFSQGNRHSRGLVNW